LRLLVDEGKSSDEIRIVGKSRSSVKGKLFNSGLNSIIVAGTLLYTAKRKRLRVKAVKLFESDDSIFSSLFSFF
jgi:hypothetical protein